MTGSMVHDPAAGAHCGEAFEQVLDAARLGAGWARTRLYQALAGPVTGYLRAQGVVDPEDAVSDVFLAVFTRLPAFEGTEAKFRSWVFTIAHHKIIDERAAAPGGPPPKRSTARRKPERTQPGPPKTKRCRGSAGSGCSSSSTG